MDVGASAEHERRKLEQVADAAAELSRSVAEEQRAREARDRAGCPDTPELLPLSRAGVLESTV